MQEKAYNSIVLHGVVTKYPVITVANTVCIIPIHMCLIKDNYGDSSRIYNRYSW
jgi:hypothetical protein